MEAIWDRAREIGKLLARTDEYAAIKRANERISDDRETVTLMNQLSAAEDRISAGLRVGREPGQEEQDEFARLAEEIQSKAPYQAVVAAQANFERLMGRINEEIARGIEAGEQSRIILP